MDKNLEKDYYMKSFFKIFKIFTLNQRNKCIYIVFFMFIGAVLEAIGIGAIMPLISIMGNENFLININK